MYTDRFYFFYEEMSAAAAKLHQLCLTLSDLMECSLPGSLSMGFSRQEYLSGLPLPSPEEMSIEAFYTFFKLNCLPAVVLKLQLLFYIFWILSCYSDTKFAGTSSHSIGCLSVDC